MRSSYVIAFLLAAGVGGWIASGYLAKEAPGREAATPADAPTPATDAPTPVIGVRVLDSHADLIKRQLELLGKTEVSRRTIVRAETGGTVAVLGADKGDKLSGGQLLVRMNEDDRPDQLAQAEALVRQRQLEYDVAKTLNKEAIGSRTKLAEAESLLAAAKAQRQRVKLDLERLEVVAPFDSVMEIRHVEIGDFIDRGDPLAVIVDLDPITVVVDVPERELSALQLGVKNPIEFVDETRSTGEVSYIASSANDTTRTFRVEMKVANADLRLREGMTAKVWLQTAQARAHLVTPAALTLDEEGGIGIKTVDDQDKVQFHKVTLVADRPEGMWLGGLPEQARIIVVGQEYVRVGQTVRPESVDGPSLNLPQAEARQ